MPRLLTKTDAQIQKDVQVELEWDTRVDETDVGVEVDAGIVTLTGTVSSWAKKMAAQEAAHRVGGVLDVANEVKVRLSGTPGWSDTDVAHAVRRALEWDVFVPADRIRSTVANGNVTLEGDVDYWTQHEDAQRAVRNLFGVRSVMNLIAIKPPRIAPQSVRSAIEEALERRAEREARQVVVAVHDDRVTVSGTVNSWAERAAVVGAAQGTPGVRAVDDQLRIGSHI